MDCRADRSDRPTGSLPPANTGRAERTRRHGGQGERARRARRHLAWDNSITGMEAERASEPNGYVEINKSVARGVVNPSFASDVSYFEMCQRRTKPHASRAGFCRL